MTIGRVAAPPAAVPRPETSIAELAARVRRSIVTVRAGVRGGTGFVALANGVVVTSYAAVANASEATVELEDGKRVAARVLACDVSRDVALVLPAEPLGMAPPLRRTASAPRLGQAAWVLARAPGERVALWQGVVTCEARARGGVPFAELGPALPCEARGAPVLDAEGRVFAIAGEGGLATPIEGVEAELSACDRPSAQLASRSPVPRCPLCGEPFAVDVARCLGCGAELPHRGLPGSPAASRSLGELLRAAGFRPSDVRRDGDALEVRHAPEGESAVTTMRIGVEEAGARLVASALVARVPARHHEAVFRLLLTLNDATTGALWLGLDGDLVVLSAVASTAAIGERDPAAFFANLARQAAHYRDALARAYGLEAVGESVRAERTRRA
jgi:hypothetical protein